MTHPWTRQLAIMAQRLATVDFIAKRIRNNQPIEMTAESAASAATFLDLFKRRHPNLAPPDIEVIEPPTECV